MINVRVGNTVSECEVSKMRGMINSWDEIERESERVEGEGPGGEISNVSKRICRNGQAVSHEQAQEKKVDQKRISGGMHLYDRINKDPTEL